MIKYLSYLSNQGERKDLEHSCMKKTKIYAGKPDPSKLGEWKALKFEKALKTDVTLQLLHEEGKEGTEPFVAIAAVSDTPAHTERTRYIPFLVCK